MAKRSAFDRKPRDLYPTPAAALEPLAAHLAPQTLFFEPCAGAAAGVVRLCPDCPEAGPVDPTAGERGVNKKVDEQLESAK